jgi:hypothetical protein
MINRARFITGIPFGMSSSKPWRVLPIHKLSTLKGIKEAVFKGGEKQQQQSEEPRPAFNML